MWLPDAVLTCIKTLQKAGYQGYAVGGCVRDWLCGLKPKDYDVTTSATPEQVTALFPRVVPTGLKYGTVTVLFGKEPVEVTTFRAEDGYSDGRRPDQVRLIDNLIEDLARRDLTVNAMAFSPTTGLIDPFGGERDIRRGIIRAVGDPAVRFEEDRLRILRAFRFAATLGYRLDTDTLKAALQQAKGISSVSAERVTGELMRTLTGTFPSRLRPLVESGGLLPWGIRPVSSLFALDFTSPQRAVRLAALCLLTGSDLEELGHRLRLDRRTYKEASQLLFEQTKQIPATESGVRRRLCEVGPTLLSRTLRLQGDLSSAAAPAAAFAAQMTGRILRRGDPYQLRMLAVTGEDLIQAGFAPGPAIKRTLMSLLDAVLEDPGCNQKQNLLRLALICENGKSPKDDRQAMQGERR